MGTWKSGPFDNDDARDWLNELESSGDEAVIENALLAVVEIGDEYLEAPECCQAIAAAEVVAALRGFPMAGLPDNVGHWVERHESLNVKKILPQAVAALERIRTDSELKELWDDAKDATAWYATLDDLEQRLTN